MAQYPGPYPYNTGYGRGRGIQPVNPAPHYNPYGRGTGTEPGAGRGREADGKRLQDIETLHQCFPKVDMEVLNALYNDMGFEQAYKAIASMEKADTQIAAHISPEKKLSFLQIVFDRLDPNFIQALLQKYQWSVDAALDELLSAEEARSAQEEQQRLYLEQQRRAQEENEKRRIYMEQEALQRRNMIQYLHASFPKLPEQTITQILHQTGFNYQAAYAQIGMIEQERQYRENQERQVREQQLRAEEDKRRQEEKARLQRATEAMGKSEIESLVKDASDWNQVLERFADHVTPAAADTTAKDDRMAVLDLVQQLYWNLDEKIIEQVLNHNNWDTKAMIPILQEMSLNKFKEEMKSKFSALDPRQVEAVAEAHYPDQSSAMTQLAVLANHTNQIQLLERALAESKARLDIAVQQVDNLSAQMAGAYGKRLEQQEQLARLPPNERNFMQTAHEMLQQREDAQFKDLEGKLNGEVERCRTDYTAAEKALNQTKQQVPEKVMPKVTVQYKIKEFETKIAQHKAERDRQHTEQTKHKQSLIAEKLKQDLGTERFAVLNEAIIRAPGGVARGCSRQTYERGEHTATATSTQTQPATLPPVEKKLSVKELQQQLGNISFSSPFPSEQSRPQPQPQQPQQTQQPQPCQYPSGYHVTPTSPHQPQRPASPPQSTQFDSQPNQTNEPNQPGQPSPYPQVAHLSEDEVYAYYFQVADANKQGYIGMNEASFFSRSGLSEVALAKIWSIASKGAAYLDHNAFNVAVKLIGMAQHGLPISTERLESQPFYPPSFRDIPPPGSLPPPPTLTPVANASAALPPPPYTGGYPAAYPQPQQYPYPPQYSYPYPSQYGTPYPQYAYPYTSTNSQPAYLPQYQYPQGYPAPGGNKQ